MSDEYSLYDAKAHLSKIVRQVRETGESVVITVHGQPAVEIRAYKPLPSDTDARIAELTARGEIWPAISNPREYVWKPRGQKRVGGLQRFLAERSEE